MDLQRFWGNYNAQVFTEGPLEFAFGRIDRGTIDIESDQPTCLVPGESLSISAPKPPGDGRHYTS